MTAQIRQLSPDLCSQGANLCPEAAPETASVTYLDAWTPENLLPRKGKRFDARGTSEVTGRTACACDLVRIRPTPTYSL